MEYDLDTGTHSTYPLQYHLVLIVKYRRKMFTEELTQIFREVVSGFADNYGVEIKNLQADRDHVHLLFNATPTTDLAKLINILKGTSARRIRNEYADHLGYKPQSISLWTDSYCLIGTGQVSLDVLEGHVEIQRERGDG